MLFSLYLQKAGAAAFTILLLRWIQLDQHVASSDALYGE